MPEDKAPEPTFPAVLAGLFGKQIQVMLSSGQTAQGIVKEASTKILTFEDGDTFNIEDITAWRRVNYWIPARKA